MTQTRVQSLARDATWSLAARLVALACSSLTALVVAASLNQHDYGAYAIVVGINVVLVMALDLGLTSSLARFAAQQRAGTSLVVRVALARFALIAAASAAVLIAWASGLLGASPLVPLLPALAMLIVAQSTLSLHFGLLPSLRRIRLLLVVTALQPLLELGLVLAVRARSGDAADMVVATASAALVTSLASWSVLLMRGRIEPKADDATFGMVARYGRAIFLVTIVIAVLGQVDQFVIGAFHPLAAVAPFALAMKLQALLAAASVTIAGIVAPRVASMAEADRAGALTAYRHWMRFLTVSAAGVVGVLGALSVDAFGVIGPQYVDDHWLLVALAPYLVLVTLAPLPSLALNQLGHAGERQRIAAVTLTVNGVLDLLLVPWMSAYGAAVGTSAAFVWYLVRHHQLAERALGGGGQGARSWAFATAGAGAAVAAIAAGVAALTRIVLELAMGDPAHMLVLIIGGGPVLIVVAWRALGAVRAAESR